MFSRSVLLVLSLSCGLLYGQTTKLSLITSSYPVTTPANFGGQVFSTLGLDVYYPTGLSTSSYITGSQLNSDFQGFLSSYPNPTDAPEAYLSVALQGILNKYPQITGGTLSAAVSGPPQVIGGVTIPGSGTPIGSVYVAIGTLTSAAAVLTGVSGQAVTSSITSSWVVTLPTGFTGQTFSTLQLSVIYPTGLPSSSYITSKQLNSDFQGFISSYPNPADPPEAYLSVSLQGILNKYTQIPGGALGATIAGPDQVIGGITIPGTGTAIGSVDVAIGNFSTALGTLSLIGLYGQTGNISNIYSSWAVTLPTGFTAQTFSSVQLSVSYPTGLAANSYITSKQLNTDFQTSISAYPNPADAPEAYLSIALQGILNKYSQMPGGELTAEIAGQGTTIGGIQIPGLPAGTIDVIIGTYNPAIGVLGFLSRQTTPDAVKRVAPGKVFPPALR